MIKKFLTEISKLNISKCFAALNNKSTELKLKRIKKKKAFSLLRWLRLYLFHFSVELYIVMSREHIPVSFCKFLSKTVPDRVVKAPALQRNAYFKGNTRQVFDKLLSPSAKLIGRFDLAFITYQLSII